MSVIWLDEGWQPLRIGYCPTVKIWRKAVQGHDPDNGPAEAPKAAGWVTYCATTKSQRAAVYICIPNPSDDPVQNVGVMVHEAQHVLQYIVREMGDDSPSDEFMAYGIQCIVQNLLVAAGDAHPVGHWGRK